MFPRFTDAFTAPLITAFRGDIYRSASCPPITQVMDEICTIFEGLGFAVAEGPDVETDYYNFEALNIPKASPCP